MGSMGSKGSGRKSVEVEVADTNLALRSLSGSRRGSVASSQRGAGSPIIPASLPDAPLDELSTRSGGRPSRGQYRHASLGYHSRGSRTQRTKLSCVRLGLRWVSAY